MAKILLTGARSPITLDLARKLHASGHTVISADTSRWHLSRYSNAILRHYKFPSPRFDIEGFITKLNVIITKEEIDIVIPVWEEVLAIAQHKDRFPKDVPIFCGSFESLNTLHNKWLFIQRVKEFGFLAPGTHLVTCQEELDALKRDKTLFLKPTYSRAAQRIHKVEPDDAMPNLEFESNNPWIAQEFIEGKQYSSYSVCHEGKVVAHVTYPLQVSIQGHACLNYEAVHHPRIMRWAQDFIAKEGYTGQAAFDFIETPDGKLYPIECNPRSTSGVHLFEAEDKIDEAYFGTYKGLIQPPIGHSKQFAFGMLLYGWRSALKEGTLRNFFKKFFSLPDVIYSRKDPMPFLMQPCLLPKYLFQSLRLQKGMPTAFNFDLDFDGE